MILISNEKLKNELIEISRKCYDRNLIVATGGNVSCRVPGEDAMLIKGSGSAFRNMDSEDVVKVDLDGNYLEGTKDVSKEWQFHAGIYKERPEVNVVIHVHPPFATAVAANHDELPLVTNHAEIYLKNVPTVDKAPSGSDKLAELAVAKFEDTDVVSVLLREHGTITVGDSFDSAFNLTEMVEDTAQIVLFNKI